MTRPRPSRLFCLALLVALRAGVAAGEEAAVEAGEASPAEEPEADPPSRFEWAPFPALGGNTDIGFLFGVNAAMSRIEPGYAPYRYRVEVIATASVKEGPDGYEFPAHHYEVGLDMPGLAGGRLRLMPELAFERVVNAGYFGLAGLSSPDPSGRRALAEELEASGLTGRRYMYLWQGPRATLDVRWTFEGAPVELLAGVEYRYVLPVAYRGSLLADDASWLTEQGDPILVGVDDHSMIAFRAGALWDRRDHEISPSNGTYAELSLRGGVGLPGVEAFAYGGLTADLRAFLPIVDRGRLVLATRLMFDLLFGEAPFYELPSFGAFDPSGFCSAVGVRSCPDGRHAAAAKLLGTAELRSLFAPFRLFHMPMVFGMVFFVAVGQTWSNVVGLRPFRDRGPAATWGGGLGLLLRWGEAVMVRIEAGYSPDASDAGMPAGIYFELGHAF